MSKAAIRTLLISLMFASAANAARFHELTCPNADPTRMVEMSRDTALASGSTPAPDCHPATRMRYLGVSGATGMVDPVVDHSNQIFVSGYTKADGTQVAGYLRNRPHLARATNN